MSQANAFRPTNVAAAVVLFDGVCNLCNGTVNFLIRRDPDARLRFGALQSPEAAELLKHHELSPDRLESIIVISNGKVLMRSDAALEIARHLPRPWPWLRILGFVPRPARDAVYELVARSRYRVFGRRDACVVPTPELQRRFL